MNKNCVMACWGLNHGKPWARLFRFALSAALARVVEQKPRWRIFFMQNLLERLRVVLLAGRALSR